ncbi:MAG: O-antigen ligase family protein [Candidatus Omnitrophica bacterium]|nr:O-antigen ligase family protein [Candidatus Omnitrophota bacterium]
MEKRLKLGRGLDRTGLFIVGSLSLAYLLFGRPFAELNIQLSFLGFPIFIGEICFFICLLIFLTKWKLGCVKLTGWHYLMFVYFLFILVKACRGYYLWGALSLRHSALFYYPLFAFFGYSFYRKEFFNQRIKFILIILLIFSMRMNTSWLFVNFHRWFIFTFFLTVIVLIRHYPDKNARRLFFILLLVVTPYKHLLCTSRMMLVSNMATIVLIFCLLVLILNLKNKHKAILFVSFSMLIAAVLLKVSPRNEVMSVVRIDKLLSTYNLESKIIEEKANYFKPREIEPKLYNPEHKFKKEPTPKISPQIQPKVESPQVLKIEVESKTDKAKQLTREVSKRLSEVKTDKEIDYREVFIDFEAEIENARKILYEILPQAEKLGLSDQVTGVLNEASDAESKIKQLRKKMQEKRTITGAQGTSLFRLYIWKDMASDIFREKPFFGFDYGKPFRSRSIEILNLGFGEWSRDGWIEPHNSYLNVIYRAGVVGIIAILFFLGLLLKMIETAVRAKSIDGILLWGGIVTLFIAANFAVILELPYNAISLWSLTGVSFAYIQGLKKGRPKKVDENPSSA